MYSEHLCFVLVFSLLFHAGSLSPLDDYVNLPDSTFGWQRLQTYPRPSYTVYVLNMTSQKWMDDTFSSSSIWWHQLIITVPRVVRRNTDLLLYIDGGSNDDSLPTDSLLSPFAVSTGSITAVIRQVPNQPIRFWSDESGSNRSEDAIIGWTWKKYLDMDGSDPIVLLQLPMTKAAIRAMDTVHQFLEQQHLPVPPKFILSGASKRGWATWLAAAIDPSRVSAAIPIVFDLINIRANMMSHYRSLNGWTFALKDYYDNNITSYMDHPMMLQLAAIVDPYSYFDRYSNIKIFQVQAAGDQFFLPDNEDYFWNDLQAATGGSFLRRLPNTDHNIFGFEESIMSFSMSISDAVPLPSFKWTHIINETHGIIRAVIDFNSGRPQAIAVTAYQARTSDNLRRDFRANKLDLTTGNIDVNPVTWYNIAVQAEGQIDSIATYSISIPIPSDGFWTASLIQAQFPGREGSTLTLTTETLILPNSYPAPECQAEGCYGQLV